MDEFDEIALETSRKAGAVKCLASEYRAGLRAIIATLETDIRASEETEDDDDDAG